MEKLKGNIEKERNINLVGDCGKADIGGSRPDGREFKGDKKGCGEKMNR